jgi:hypothetical protein
VSALNSLIETRQITERNVSRVKETVRGTESLAERSQSLTALIDALEVNGRSVKKKKKRAKK